VFRPTHDRRLDVWTSPLRDEDSKLVGIAVTLAEA
jgi:hypothetical protein